MKKMWIVLMAALVAIPAFASAGMMDNTQEHHSYYVGGFVENNGAVTGRFVNFSFDENGGMQDFTVNNVMVFQEISYENETVGNYRVMGPVFMYWGVQIQGFPSGFGDNGFPEMPGMNETMAWKFIHVHDNPAGVLHIVEHGSDAVKFTLAQGVNATLVNSTVELSGAVDAYILVANGAVSVESGEITVRTGINNGTTSIVFLEPGHWKIPRKIRHRIMEGIREGKVGGEMYIGAKGTDFVNYSYQMRASVQVEKQNHIQIKVSSEEHQGKVMVINADKDMLQYDEHHRIVVKFDGNRAKEVSVDEVMQGGTEAKYAVVDNGDSVSILVYIPHFSEHTIDVESEAVSAVSTVASNPLLLGVMALIVVLVIVAVAWKIKSR